MIKSVAENLMSKAIQLSLFFFLSKCLPNIVAGAAGYEL